jgi:outer membrane lipoprotein carrier protein
MRLLGLLMASALCAPAAVAAGGQDRPAAPPALPPNAAERSLDEIARGVQQRYDRVRDFSASFVHVYEGGVLRRAATEKGTVRIKKPGMMRWEYTTPEKKTFVSDGSQIYSYIPADRQVIVSPMPRTDQATTAALFLTGKGNLTRDFEVSAAPLPAGAPAGTMALKLEPNQAERDYETLTLVVDEGTLQIRMLMAADRQGGTSIFGFSDIKENTGLADNVFNFRIPRGADVIRSGSQDRP